MVARPIRPHADGLRKAGWQGDVNIDLLWLRKVEKWGLICAALMYSIIPAARKADFSAGQEYPVYSDR